MTDLSNLKNTSRPFKKVQRVGRGPGSNRGKTCGRGEKGAKSRSGYKERAGKEGGQFPLFRKLPVRGFPNTKFKKHFFALNFWQIDKWFQDGERVDETTLRDRGLVKGRYDGIKLLANGELTKKVSIHVDAASQSARDQLEGLKIEYTVAANS
ncbi:MAG: 50S ribosomal protein L15 [Parachlamydiales bacterium]|nr:50S ribosomal protein L15 [Parachlamydiales bacterium]